MPCSYGSEKWLWKSLKQGTRERGNEATGNKRQVSESARRQESGRPATGNKRAGTSARLWIHAVLLFLIGGEPVGFAHRLHIVCWRLRRILTRDWCEFCVEFIFFFGVVGLRDIHVIGIFRCADSMVGLNPGWKFFSV